MHAPLCIVPLGPATHSLLISINILFTHSWGAIKNPYSVAYWATPRPFRSFLCLCSKPCSRHTHLLSHGLGAVKFFHSGHIMDNPWRPTRGGSTPWGTSSYKFFQLFFTVPNTFFQSYSYTSSTMSSKSL